MILKKKFSWVTHYFITLILIAGLSPQALAKNRIVNLTVAYKTVYFTGKPARAIAINNQIPGPTLHFKDGDHVTINVHNHIDRGTSMHWHGLIIPWKMDGVEGVTQKAIPPGGVFHYAFTLHQYGTYWYHAHSEFQEQKGVYGAMIIDPPTQTLHYNKDYVVVLSDWNNTNPDQVYANLKKEGDFYAINFPMQPSLTQFFCDYNAAKTPHAKKKILNAYKMMQTMRMSVYDISDVAYDAYLLNGRTKNSPWVKNVKVGDVVRLRFIGAGASTIFRVKIPGSTMKLVQADGNDIKPYTIKYFTIAPGETFDVLVKITKNHPYIIYTESIDHLGTAVGVLKTQPHQVVNYKNIKPFPEPKPVVMMNHSMHKKTMKMKTHSSKTKYDRLQALVKTNNPKTPTHIIRMNLNGYMDHYIWFLNGVPRYKAKPIMINHGQWYRIIFTNSTMMHHPMHIHGHWFILRNGHGAYDPKLHTIDVPPGATVVADLHANASGQWFFHCHNLMHMKAGMANIFRYKETPTIEFDNFSEHKLNHWYFTNELELSADFIHNSYEGTLETYMGPDYNKLQFYAKDVEMDNGKITNANMDIFYWRLIDQFWAVKGGLNYVYLPAATPYLQPGVGIEGLMPYFFQTDIHAYLHDDSAKLDIELARNTQITHRLFLRLSVDSLFASKTIAKDEIGSGLNSLQWTVQPYVQINPNIALYFQYKNTHYYGTLRELLSEENEPTQKNTYSLGISLLF